MISFSSPPFDQTRRFHRPPITAALATSAVVVETESQKAQLRIAEYWASVNVDKTGRSCISQAGLILLFE